MSRERFDWLRAMGRRSGRHHPHAGHREQRQGNLRQVRRARARQAQRHPQSVLRVSQLSDPLSLHRRRASIASSTRLKRDTQHIGWRPSCRQPDRPARIAAGDRPQEAPRHEDRRGRSARMSDHAVQRLRRAQHPGHRRQAHSADPQRDEHRRRDRRLRSRHRFAQSAVRQRCRPQLSCGRRKIDPARSSQFDDVGISGLANIVASPSSSPSISIYGADDVVMTVATDSAALYDSERDDFSAGAIGRLSTR